MHCTEATFRFDAFPGVACIAHKSSTSQIESLRFARSRLQCPEAEYEQCVKSLHFDRSRTECPEAEHGQHLEFTMCTKSKAKVTSRARATVRDDALHRVVCNANLLHTGKVFNLRFPEVVCPHTEHGGGSEFIYTFGRCRMQYRQADHGQGFEFALCTRSAPSLSGSQIFRLGEGKRKHLAFNAYELWFDWVDIACFAAESTCGPYCCASLNSLAVARTLMTSKALKQGHSASQNGPPFCASIFFGKVLSSFCFEHEHNTNE